MPQTGVGIGNKAERALRAKQIRDARRVEILDEKRNSRSAPKVVALLALNEDVDMAAFIGDFAAAAGAADCAGLVKSMSTAPNVPVTFAVDRHRHRLSLLVVRAASPLAALEVIKVADLLLVVSPVTGAGTGADAEAGDDDDMVTGTSGGAGTTSVGDVEASAEVASTLQVLRAQGLPPALCALQGLEHVPHKKRAAVRHAATAAVQRALQLPADRVKAVPADSRAEQLELVRQVAEQRGVQPRWRAQRAYLLAERADVTPEPPAGYSPEVGTAAGAGAGAEGGTDTVTVTIDGYVRGATMSANQLVHLPGVGDFPVERIVSAPEPCGGGRKGSGGGSGGGGGDAAMGDFAAATHGVTLQVPDALRREAAMRENLPDTLAGEQTWPTEEEMADADNNKKEGVGAAGNPNVKRKPKGWSDYQAAWIPDSDSDEYNSDEEEEEEEEKEDINMDAAEDGGGSRGRSKSNPGDNFGDEAEMREGGGDVGSDDEDEDGDDEWVNQGDGDGGESEPDEETVRNLDDAQRDSIKRAMLAAAEEEQLDFPDEVETPLHISARDRFARYRGLKSFRSSPWDAKEQLPVDYARVFAFENFRRAARRAAESAEENAAVGIAVGTFVRVVVRGVPREAAAALLGGEGAYSPVVPAAAAAAAAAATAAAGAGGAGGAVGVGGVGPAWSGWCGGGGPVVLSSLMQHECKLTVMHYGVTKTPSYEPPLRSKTPLWFHVGFRRERAAPIFSTDGLGDKHKFERFLHHRRPSMASVYGPVAYPPSPVLAFKEEMTAAGMGAALVMSGSVRKADPDRVILKRIILTGVPFKVHKSKAVVRQMFFTPDDIRWFKPLELWTKAGAKLSCVH